MKQPTIQSRHVRSHHRDLKVLKYSSSHPSHCLLMGSQQGVAESGRHLPWATAICNHDQSSDPSAGSPVVSFSKLCCSERAPLPLASPAGSHAGGEGVAGTVPGGDTSGHQAQAFDRSVCRTYWSVKGDIHPLLSSRRTTICHPGRWATFCRLTVYSGCVLCRFSSLFSLKVLIYIPRIQLFVVLSLTASHWPFVFCLKNPPNDGSHATRPAIKKKEAPPLAPRLNT